MFTPFSFYSKFSVTPPTNTAFEFSVKTDNAGTSNSDQFTLPLTSAFNGITAEVDWGDGSSDTITAYNQSEITHTYASSGTYTISITNALRAFRFANGGDKLKILNISNWGIFEFNISQAFNGCTNLTQTATDSPTISTTDLNGTFANCSSFNGYINDWDVSNVQDFRFFLSGAAVFNQPLNGWDVSSGTRFTQFFRFARQFNQPLSNWDVSNATKMESMFYANTVFNQDLSNWDVGNVDSMNQMFRFTNSITNVNIGNWNMSSITNVYGMLRDSDAFDESLANWDINQITTFGDFMRSSDGLSTANYDATLIGWAAQVPLSYSGTLNMGNSVKTLGGAAEAAFNTIETNSGGAGAIDILDGN
jgi:surface protein